MTYVFVYESPYCPECKLYVNIIYNTVDIVGKKTTCVQRMLGNQRNYRIRD